VFLHDNSISKLDNIHYMAASSSISILTLYDTPLSLRPNYRHHLVNSLWSLKSLDNYVISDEEIIEDSSFGGRYAPLQPSFYIKPSCSLTKVNVTEPEIFFSRKLCDCLWKVHAIFQVMQYTYLFLAPDLT